MLEGFIIKTHAKRNVDKQKCPTIYQGTIFNMYIHIFNICIFISYIHFFHVLFNYGLL